MLVAGRMPTGLGNEIVIPKSLLKSLGLSAEEALGKTVDFEGAVYNWDSGSPILMPVSITAEIVGVADTTAKYEDGGHLIEFSVDDSFFFSKTATVDMRTQANIKKGEGNFSLRAKSPADMIAIKDELNAQGIVPLGRFELVEDMVRLNSQATQQSGSAVIIIGVLAVVVVLAVAVVTAAGRKHEYAIYKVSGYSSRHLILISAAEGIILSAAAALFFLIMSPFISLATKSIWGVNIASKELLGTGILLLFGMGMLGAVTASVFAVTTKASASLKSGER